jgi:hypothetical protein
LDIVSNLLSLMSMSRREKLPTENIFSPRPTSPDFCRAVELLQQHGINVVLGAMESDPEKAVLSHLSGALATGDNICDHGG